MRLKSINEVLGRFCLRLIIEVDHECHDVKPKWNGVKLHIEWMGLPGSKTRHAWIEKWGVK